MKDKKYFLEKWKEMKCSKKHSSDCKKLIVKNKSPCHNCIYYHDTLLILCDEGIF